MSGVRIRELATGVASCVMLLPAAGCKKTSTEVSVDPGSGEPVADAPAPAAECEAPTAGEQPVAAAGDDREAPRILAARFVARDRVQLTFSEALGPIDQVNPRQFRLSMAYSMVAYDYGYKYGGPDVAYASGYYYDLAGPDAYEPPLVVLALDRYDDQPELLALRLSRPVPTDLCEEIQDTEQTMADEAAAGPAGDGRVGLFLHYTSRGSVGVRDLAQNPLEDMGGEWALHFGARNKSVYGSEPAMRLDLLVELECPVAMAGS